MTTPRVLAVVPARAGSKGLRNKNLRLLAGRPLVSYPIELALQLPWVDTVVCSTDDREIASVAEAQGAYVPGLRPAEYAQDESLIMDVLFYTLESLLLRGQSFDFLLLLEPTSPLTEALDVDNAFNLLLSMYGKGFRACLSLRGLREIQPDALLKIDSVTHQIKPKDSKFWRKPRNRQTYESWFVPDGSFYLSSTKSLKRWRTFVQPWSIGVVMPPEKNLEIDTELDLSLAEVLLKKLRHNAETELK